MTDTPRTEAELLTIFADNQNHGITAQDMRDFVVSTAKLDRTQAVSLYCFGQSISIANNTQINLPFDVTNAMYTGTIGNERTLYDPQGYVTTGADDPEPYAGLLGGFYLTGLPVGSVWCVQLIVVFASGTFDPTDVVYLSSPYAAPPYEPPVDPADDDAQGIWGTPNYAYGAFNIQRFVSPLLTGIFTMPLYDDARLDFWNVQSGWAIQQSGDTQTITSVEYDMWRIR